MQSQRLIPMSAVGDPERHTTGIQKLAVRLHSVPRLPQTGKKNVSGIIYRKWRGGVVDRGIVLMVKMARGGDEI